MRQPSLIRPLIRILRLPRPLYPPLCALISARLRLPILPQKRLVRRTEAGRVPGQAGAAPDKGRAGVGPVVSGADEAAVEVFGAVGGGGGPFADDEPEGEGGERGGEGAGVGDVLGVCSLVFLGGGKRRARSWYGRERKREVERMELTATENIW